MANSGNIVDVLRANIVIDSDATLATGTAVTIGANRQFALQDYVFAVTTNNGQGGDPGFVIQSVSALGVPTNQGLISAAAVGWKRPTSTNVAGGTGDCLGALAGVARGSILRVIASTGETAIRGNGTIVLTPGNRYAAGPGTYYPNNATALQYKA